jgi:type IV fimbrial biogenesis protein FimT
MANFYNFPLSGSAYREAGFSLVEVMVVTAIIGILVVTGISWGQNYTANNRVRSAAESLQTALATARNEAIKRNRIVTLVLDGTAQEWRVEAINRRPPPGPATETEVIRRGSYLDTREITVTPTNLTITFDAFGRPDAARNFVFESQNRVCQALPGGNIRCLRVALNAGGQATTCDPVLLYANDPRGCRPLELL